MDVFNADINNLKLIFPFLEYRDILNFVCSSHIVYDSLIREIRQITISFNDLSKLFQNISIFLKKIVDPSKQLCIRLGNENNYKNSMSDSDHDNDSDNNKSDSDDNEDLELSSGKESLLRSVKSSFPYSLLSREVDFPPLLKLSSVPVFFISLCEVYPSFTVRKLHLFEVEDENIAAYLSPHLTRVLEDLILPSWPGEVPFPQLSPTLQSLSVGSSTLRSLPPSLPNLKHLRLEECDNTHLDLIPYDLETLELKFPRVLDFKKISDCKRLVVHYPQEVKNKAKAKQFQQIEFKEIDVQHFPKKSLQTVRDINLTYSEPDGPISIHLSSFPNLQRFEVNCAGSELGDTPVTLRVNNKTVPKRLKVVKIHDFSSTMNLSWFSNVYEINLKDCNEVTCLSGLEKVPRVIIECLPLQNLDGLGGNDYVEVVYCSSLHDFSPLKYVREVKIKHCVGFKNSEEVAYVEKLSIIQCNELTDLSKLVKVRELYLDHCDKVVYCGSLDKIPKISIKHCKKLKQYHVTPINDFGIRDLGVHDGLSSLPDILHLEILKYLQESQFRSMISCNTHFYQRYRKTSFETEDPPFKFEDEVIASETLQIPLTTKAVCFESCSFSSASRFPRGLKQIEFDYCDGMKNITDFCEVEEVRIGRSSVDQYNDEDDGDDSALNLASLNRIKRLILDAREEIKDYSPLQDNEEITIFRYLNSNDDQKTGCTDLRLD
eukprot:gene3914-4181_t